MTDCDGAEDPRERCGLHHQLTQIEGRCCCDEPWAATECSTSNPEGAPVDLRSRIHAMLAYSVADAAQDVGAHTDAVMDILAAAPAPVVDPDAFDNYEVSSASEVWLTCPRPDCRAEVHASLDQEASGDPLTLGDLMGMAVDHEADAHGGYQPHPCTVADLPGVGETRVQGDLDEQGRTHMAEVVRAVQRKAREDLKAEGRAELLDTLLALRTLWDRRRTERAVHRDHPEAAIARAASVEHNAYSRILVDLDQALEALAVNNG